MMTWHYCGLLLFVHEKDRAEERSLTVRESAVTMESLPLFSLVLLAIACLEVKGKLMLYGEGVPLLDDKEQICPKANSNDRKYVRIKTFNNKYVWANPKHKGGGSYLRTRCCGGKDAVGRDDVTVPGRRTTFMVHCLKANNQNVFRFEILNWWNNNPSGYFFYANPSYYQYGLYAYKPTSAKAKYAYRFNFIIKRWRGPILAIRTQGKAGARADSDKSNWLKFRDDGDGYVSGYQNLYRSPPGFPSLTDAFTLESVPSGCIDGAAERDRVSAAPDGTSHEECESKSDRCFWTDGWDNRRRRMEQGTCYYNRESKCHWSRTNNALPRNRLCVVSEKTIMSSADECEAANCCYDYKRNQCYKPL
ncbi:hypothetical protein ACROYT_G043135 [Oculina patagonica]